MVTVYALRDNGKIFYIGQTTQINNRLYGHKSTCINKRTKKEKRIFDVISNNRVLDYIVLAECSVHTANVTERNFIISYLDKGYKLTNKKPNTNRIYIPAKRKVNNEIFSHKDRYILQLMANDYDTNDISIITGKNTRTIEVIRKRLKDKAKVNTIGALMYFAYNNKLVT